MLSDDDLESVASDSSTYQRLIARVRVKSEAKSESVSATVRTGRLNDLDDDDDPADQGDDNNDDSEEDVFHTSLAINIQEASLKTIDIQAIIDDAENVGGNDDLEDGDMDWQVQDDDFEPLEDDHSSSRASSPESGMSQPSRSCMRVTLF
jgi:hypothetical protein